MNLLPSKSLTQRFYSLWLILISALILGCLYTTLYVKKMISHKLSIEINQEVRLSKSLTMGKQRERADQETLKKNEPFASYQNTVDQLKQNQASLKEIMDKLNSLLPKDAQLFQTEAFNQELKVCGFFNNPKEAIDYVQQINKEPQFQEASIDCIGNQCSTHSPQSKPNQVIVQFHISIVQQTNGRSEPT